MGCVSVYCDVAQSTMLHMLVFSALTKVSSDTKVLHYRESTVENFRSGHKGS